MNKTIKKCTSFVLVAAMLLSMACFGAFAERAPFRYGDVNGDGKVSAADAMEVSKHTAAIIKLEGDAFKAADVNGDGIVSVKDAILIQQYVAKIIDVFPVELLPTEPPTEEPTQNPTSEPTQAPTQAPTERPTERPTSPHEYNSTVNGYKANTGDEVIYTSYLSAKDLVAGVNAHVDYSTDILKISDITLSAKKKEVLPILSGGSCVLNFNPIDGTKSIYFNAANADEGYDFTASDSVLVTVRFDIIGKGDASIDTVMTQILGMETDASGKNLPLKEYTLNGNTVVIPNENPTEPTETPTQAPTQKPTEDPTEAPTQAPTEAPTQKPTEAPTQAPTEKPTTAPSADATVNGQKAHIGDQVVYTAYLKSNEAVAGVNAHVTYTGSVLKLSDETLGAKKKDVIPVLASGSSVLNFDPVDGTDSVYFNAAEADEGYDFSASNTVLVTLKFDVIGKGTADIKTVIAQILGMTTDSTGKNQPLTNYTLTDKTTVVTGGGSVDPTEPPTEAPTQKPTEDPTEAPTQTPTEKPTTAPSADATVNGQKAHIGDQVVYTAYLKSNEAVAGINAHVTYTGSVLKLSDETLGAKKKDVIPVLASGSSVLNFDPVDGTDSVYFNAAEADEGYDFSASNTVLVTLKFDVIGKGTADIKTIIAQILGMTTDSTGKNQPLTNYTLTDKTTVVTGGGSVDPTEPPTEIPTQKPTEDPTEAPTQAPTEKPTTAPSADATVNGQKAHIGDQVVYTAYLKSNEAVAGVNAHVTYTGSVLKLSDETLGAKKKDVIPVLASGSSVLNFDPVDGTDSVYFNAAEADEGYDFSASNTVLVTLKFDVIGKGTADIKTIIAQILGMTTDSTGKNQPLTNYTLTDKTTVVTGGGSVDPTEPPTEAPTQKPTEDPTEAPTQTPTEKPTTAPSADATVNGQKAHIGDQVVYTAYLKSNEVVAGVNAHVTYTGSVLKLSDETLNSKKKTIIPVLASGSSVLNFDPVDGTDSVYFNAAEADEGYDFSASNTVLVTLKFDVIGKGTADIKTIIAQILGMTTDSTGKNQPLTNYTLTDKTTVVTGGGSVDPTEPPTEAPTQKPTEDPTEAPTQAPTEKPTTAPSADATVNGQKAHIGDQVVYTAYLKSNEAVAGINAHVTYTGSVLKLSDETLGAKKKDVIPVLASGSSVLNFDPVDGTDSVYFNAAEADEGYDFSASNTVLVTLKFDVIGKGTADIKTIIAQILGMTTDSTGKNQPLTNYTLTDKTTVVTGGGSVDPTEPPTEIPTQKPTEDPTEAPTQAPTEKPTTAPSADATVNGQKAHIGDQVVYTAYLKSNEAVAGINAHVTYTGSVLKLSDETLGAKKKDVIPVLASGSSVLNFDPVDGTDSVYFNAAEADEGYDFSASNTVLVTLKFDVIGKGTADIKTVIAQILGMTTDSTGKNQPLTNYTLTDKTTVVTGGGSVDPTEPPTEAPTQKPTEDPTEAPTEKPTTAPSADATVNGQKAHIGDQVVYTAYLKSNEVVAGVNAHVTYTGSVLKLSDETLNSKKKTIIPVLASGSSVLNFDPVDGTDSVYFNAAEADEGYDFSASNTVLVTLKFDVIGKGTADIKTVIAQILGMATDSTGKNQPLTNYTLTDKTTVVTGGGSVDPTEPPTETPTQAPTETPTQKPSGDVDAVVNGVGVQIGDKVTYTAYVSTKQLAAGIVAYIPYTDGVLKLSDETLSSKKKDVIPTFSTGSSVLNFTPVDGSSAVFFNAANADEGYECPVGSVLITLTFDVVAKGTATIDTQITQFLSMPAEAGGKYQDITDYKVTSSITVK